MNAIKDRSINDIAHLSQLRILNLCTKQNMQPTTYSSRQAWTASSVDFHS